MQGLLAEYLPILVFIGVAGFIGSPGMNFLNGEVVLRNGAAYFVAQDIEVPLAKYAFDNGGARASQAVFGLRPEHVAVNAGADWPFAKNVQVEIVEPMGSDTLVWTRIGGQSFNMRVTSERAPAVGDTISIGFDPINASIFDSATDARL
mgnify:FL=1